MNNKIKIAAYAAHIPEVFLKNKLFSKEFCSHTFYDKFTSKIEIYLRDDDNRSLIRLKELLELNNFVINTGDLFLQNEKIDFEFHFYGNLKRNFNSKLYCILPEIKQIDRNCSKEILEKKYDKIFTNIDKDVDNIKFFKLNSPQIVRKFKIGEKRKNFACIISSNKNLNTNSENSGYIKRIKIIKWFLKNHPSKLDIYGKDWDKYFFSNYYLNRIMLYLQKKIKFRKKNIHYAIKGPIKSKREILKQYKFNICYENYLNEEGYFTGIIFDSFNSGCIPVFCGSKNIKKYIPQDCFIDGNKFLNITSLYKFLEKIDDNKIIYYQKNISNFLDSKFMKEFGHEKFTNIILNHLILDSKNNEN